MRISEVRVRPGGQVYIKCTSPGFAPLSTLSPNNPSHHRKMHPEVIGNLLVSKRSVRYAHELPAKTM